MTDGRACGDYCTDHAQEIRLNVVPDIRFIRIADERQQAGALARSPEPG